MQVRGIHHVSINVDDLADALEFYVGKLGFSELPRPDFGFPGAWIATGADQVHLLEIAGQPRSETQHWAFDVEDLDAAIADLEAHGVEYRVSRSTDGGRSPQAFLRDPSGNLIELQQPMASAP